MSIRVHCPCGASLDFTERLRGKTARCPRCSGTLKLLPNSSPSWHCTGCSTQRSGLPPEVGTLCDDCVSRATADLNELLDPSLESIINLADFPSVEDPPVRNHAPPRNAQRAAAPATAPNRRREAEGQSPGSASDSLGQHVAALIRWLRLSRNRLAVVIAFVVPLSGMVLLWSVAVAAGTQVSLNPVRTIANIGLQQRLDRIIKADPRNEGVRASAYFGGSSGQNVVVFDLKEIRSGSRLDVFRVLLDFADALADSRCDSAELACRGVTKFRMDGDYFQKLGRERKTQNSAYTIRTFPENLQTLEGDRAFPEWEGGVLGVLGKQMEDFTTMHNKWYGELIDSSP